jgi:hypothetical protein
VSPAIAGEADKSIAVVNKSILVAFISLSPRWTIPAF